jgi:hypothetical protein
MTVEQTVEIPDSRRLVFELPPGLPTGRAKIALTLSFGEPPTAERETAMAILFRYALENPNTTAAYLERHWADNDFERSLELRREKEREQYRGRRGS